MRCCMVEAGRRFWEKFRNHIEHFGMLMLEEWGLINEHNELFAFTELTHQSGQQ